MKNNSRLEAMRAVNDSAHFCASSDPGDNLILASIFDSLERLIVRQCVVYSPSKVDLVTGGKSD
jgi:hypothetical protein